MAKVKVGATQSLTVAEANEAKLTGAIDRLRICLELCMKAACGQDLGLLDGDPLVHSPAVEAVVELRHSLDRQRDEVTRLNNLYFAELGPREFLCKIIGTFLKVIGNERVKELDEVPEGIDPKYIEIGQKIIELATKFRQQTEQLILCRKIANGEAEQIDPIEGSAVEAVQELRGKFERGEKF